MLSVRTYLSVLTSVGSNIKKIRIARRLSQNELAGLCHMQKASLSRIEHGKNNSTLLSLKNIANALKVEIIELFLASQDVANNVNKI
jgi:transcriptional regulator with XRE-family HTH domain